MTAAAPGLQPAAALVILATGLEPHQQAWGSAQSLARDVARSCAPILGFEPEVRLAASDSLARDLENAAVAGEILVVPCAFEFGLLHREAIGRAIGETRRNHPDIAIYHDDIDPGHSLIVDCLAELAAQALASRAPQHCGLILAPSGHPDASTRAQSYRLMRLVWERLGLAAGEVGFIRHTQPFLLSTLEKCAASPLHWVILPQTPWTTEHVEYAQVILANFQRTHPEALEWKIAALPADHPAVTAWLLQRITRLWNEKRSSESIRVASLKHSPAPKSD